jgi:hypothetical protein
MYKGRGGNIIGHGHDKNVVFTLDEVPEVFPDMSEAVLESKVGDVAPVVLSMTDILREEGVLYDTLALKYVSSPYEEVGEVRNNSLVRLLFSEAGLVDLTVLHPVYDVLRVSSWKQTKKTRREAMEAAAGLGTHPKPSPRGLAVVYRRMIGSLDMVDDGHLAEVDLFRMAGTVLGFLTILHGHGYMHLDIKPPNILFDVRQGRVHSLLGDYGDITPMAHVLDRLRTRGVYDAGTYGFMSPLLTDNEEENRVFDAFRMVSARAETTASKDNPPLRGGFFYATDDVDDVDDVDGAVGWRRLFEHQRSLLVIPSDVAKVDLHSLGLVLVGMMRDPEATIRDPDSSMGTFVKRLFMFGPHDFRSAQEALVYLCKIEKENTGCSDRVIRALRKGPVTSIL